MIHRTILFIAIILLAATPQIHAETHQVEFDTTAGRFTVGLDADAAPKTVANFLEYVRTGFYNGTIFHRVIKGFMIQGGGLNADMQKKPTRQPVVNEADNGKQNLTGTIAMARTADPHSATAQFFINVKNNGFLDYRAKNGQGWGYCVFGRVIKGMDIVHQIENAKTTTRFGRQDVPVTPIVINKATLLTTKIR